MVFKVKTYAAFAIATAGIGGFFLGGLFTFALLTPVEKTADVTLEPITVEYEVTNRVYVSKNGTRYYPWWCEAGSRIIEENKIWFDTADIAKEAGYTIAKSCL